MKFNADAMFTFFLLMGFSICLFSDISRLDKTPLLANGYNPPPTHLNPMQYMQMNHHQQALMNPALAGHGLSRSESAALMKGQAGLPGMEAIAR